MNEERNKILVICDLILLNPELIKINDHDFYTYTFTLRRFTLTYTYGYTQAHKFL